ncbi:MAG: hypothetical protein ACJAQ4_001026 [Cryomorphaceae bacterium]
MVFIGFENIGMLDKTERKLSWNTSKNKGDLTSIASRLAVKIRFSKMQELH